ncbi:hypothetical protein Ancab_040428 [Ancistrocladus abbreviatus]
MSADRGRSHITASDLWNPLFVHPADQVGQAIVPFKLIGASNYRQWSKALEKALSSKHKLGLIRGTILRTDENCDMWDRCNDLCCAWILGVVSAEIYDNIFELDNAYEIWKELEDCYAHHTGPSKFQIIKEIHSIEQGTLTVAEYYTKLKALWQRLFSMRASRRCECSAMADCTCDVIKNIEKEDEEEKLMTFLMGLNDTYVMTRGNLLLMTPLPSVSRAYQLVSQEEDQRKLGKSAVHPMNENSSVFMTRQADTGNEKEGKCEHCDGNHSPSKCWEKYGYPEWHPASKDRPQKAGIVYEPRKRGKKKGYKGGRSQAAAASQSNETTAGDMTTLQLTAEQQTLVHTLLNLLDKTKLVHGVNVAGPVQDPNSGEW